MKHARWRPVGICGALFLAAAAPATQPAGPAAGRDGKLFAPSQFSRYLEDGDKPRLEVSIVTLKGADGFTVDLVSAVHIADQAYYQALNKRFEKYDAVLFELISSGDHIRPEKGQKSNSPVSMLQRTMKSVLGLTFQLDEIDYSKANFVHADMDVEDFFAAQEARGESLMGLMVKAWIDSMSATPPPPKPGEVIYKPVDWGTTPETRRRALKLVFAQTLGDLERQALQLDGPEGSAILTDRNDACLKVLREERKAGKKHVAIFYGAAHMPDMATKLVRQDGLKYVKTEWLRAWDIQALPATQPSAAQPAAQPAAPPAK